MTKNIRNVSAQIVHELVAIEAIQKITNTKGEDETVLQGRLNEIFTNATINDLVGMFPGLVKREKRIYIQGQATKKIDFLLYKLPLEIKSYGRFDSATEIEDARQQCYEYYEALIQLGHKSSVCAICDGKSIYYIDSKGILGHRIEMSKESLAELIILAKDISSLLFEGESLAAVFTRETDAPLKLLAQSLYNCMQRKTLQKTSMLYAEWHEIFKLGRSTDTEKEKQRQEALSEQLSTSAKSIKISNQKEEYAALFALYTAYSIFVKRVAHRALEQLGICNTANIAITKLMKKIECGEYFRNSGIYNLMEGDYFEWYLEYLDTTDTELHTETKTLHAVLDGILTTWLSKFTMPKDSRHLDDSDMFRVVYEELMPATIRRTLGEFFTPLWLAEHTVKEAIVQRGDKAPLPWRGIDCCCGSGAFVVAMIRQKINENADLADILANVAGIDINPLSALAARVNYFLNIYHLISEKIATNVISKSNPILIPVFLADTCNFPELNNELLTQNLETIKGTVQLSFPEVCARDLPKLFSTLENFELSIIGQDLQAAKNELLTLLPSNRHCDTELVDALNSFADAIYDLEKQKWNGVWGRILANKLSAAMMGRFDILVGNPPWVKWGDLPDKYRDTLKNKAFTYSLFSDSKHLGGNSLNICALILFAAVHKLANDRATIAYLMPNDLLFTPSHSAWRAFDANGINLELKKLFDWSNAGSIFTDVGIKFFTYIFEGNYDTNN